MQANWDKKYFTKAGHFAHADPGWDVSPTGEMSHLGKMSYFIWRVPKMESMRIADWLTTNQKQPFSSCSEKCRKFFWKKSVMKSVFCRKCPKTTPSQLCCCEFYGIFQNHFSREHFKTAAFNIFNPNKPGLFEGSFFLVVWGAGGRENLSNYLIYQKELI